MVLKEKYFIRTGSPKRHDNVGVKVILCSLKSCTGLAVVFIRRNFIRSREPADRIMAAGHTRGFVAGRGNESDNHGPVAR